jgi:predicted DNA-binding helix-hairpin-helix protein
MRKLKIPLKRCVYFITCNGRYEGGAALDSPGLRDLLSTGGRKSIASALADR